MKKAAFLWVFLVTAPAWAAEEQGIAIELSFTSFDDYWYPFLDGQGPAGVYATSKLPDADRDRLVDDWLKR